MHCSYGSAEGMPGSRVDSGQAQQLCLRLQGLAGMSSQDLVLNEPSKRS